MKPEHVYPFPKRLVNFVLIPRMMRMEWGLEAFRTGSREVLVETNQGSANKIGETSPGSNRRDTNDARKF